MLIPHHHESAHIDAPLEEVTKNLVENLHLRWGYGVFQVDEYTDEENFPVCVVYGAATINNTTFLALVIRLEALDRYSTGVTIECGTLSTGGYPLNRPSNLDSSREHETGHTRKAVEDILKFCTTPHGQGFGIADMMRSLVERVWNRSGTKDKRRYKR
jgi:hypothetical protein